ncbi:predicted protein [Streptomyces viridochromogenes DSM 40736]|uniref:Predicted protein n=1 Tax=Streptomyces viridochromogenes (strain DSM 40736 / JCM 4977 / BCRC 1201 / Tue 494) TaxID=591159 RepID=D9XGC3_STRVT|nr:predicted protein [Streptomyces viridochromogenes DSM 40736]
MHTLPRHLAKAGVTGAGRATYGSQPCRANVTVSFRPRSTESAGTERLQATWVDLVRLVTRPDGPTVGVAHL